MDLQNFNWNNGTAESPIVLNQTQIEALLTAYKKGVTMNVSGYINTATGTIYKYLKYSLSQSFPNLHVLATEIDDNFTLSTTINQIKEGSEAQLALSGIDPNFINFVVEHSITNADGILTNAAIQSRMHVDPQSLKFIVDAPQENSSWVDNVTIKAFPEYEDPNTSTNFKSVEILVTAVAIDPTQSVLQYSSRVASGNSFAVSIRPYPAESTKLAGAQFAFSGSNGIVRGSASNILVAPVLQDDNDVSATVYGVVYLFGHNLPDISLSGSITIYAGDITRYTLTQEKPTDNSYHAPEDMIEGYDGAYIGFVNGTAPKITIDGVQQFKDNIQRIRANSHIYVGNYNATERTLEVKQVSDTDKTLYADGSAVTITENDNLDMFMKLPEFWWKPTEIEEDVLQVEFSMTEADVDSSWQHWEGNTFIGVYEGFLKDGNFYSKPGVTPTVSQSWNTLRAAARNRSLNNRHTLISYEAHQIMAYLGYGYLGTTDAQGIVGVGTSNYPKTTGLCDAKGMYDTTHGQDGETNSINFWGLENWWGDIAEWIDNIQTQNNSGLINILDASGQMVRQVQAHCQLSTGGEIGKFEFGEYGDLIPKEIHSNGNYNRAYAEHGSVVAASGRVAYRSYSAAYLHGGLGYLLVYGSAGDVGASIGSRLQYKGNYTLVNNFSV